MAQKLAELYDTMCDKAKFFSRFVEKIFATIPAFKYLSPDAVYKGFFFVFVYKDFIIREIVNRIRESLPQVAQKKILA